MKRISVLLVDDNKLLRHGLGLLLSYEDDMEVVGEAEDGQIAVQFVKKHRPEVVIMDVAMPILNGFEATQQILKSFPTTKIIILSAHSDDAYVEQLMALGAAGYLVKQTSSQILAKAIREVHDGKIFFDSSASKHIQERYQKKLVHREKKGAELQNSQETLSNSKKDVVK